MSNPLDDFDPFAALAAPALHEPSEHWGESLEVPVSLDVLAAGRAPGETPEAWLDRAAAAARAADTSGLLQPARAVRSASPHYAPPPPLPYPFDGKNRLADVAIARLALPATDARSANERTKAALLLVREYETRHHSPLVLFEACRLWWLAARRLVDIAAALQRPGLTPNALRARAVRPVAHDFAAAKGIPPAARPKALEEAGIPMPRDKKGKPTSDGTGGSFVL